MKGVVLDATAIDWISFNDNISMDIMVGLDGISGAITRVTVPLQG